MNSRERLLAAIGHAKPDHVPMLCWCFGSTAPPKLRWRQNGKEVAHWYTMRLEHIHTLPEPWSVEDSLSLYYYMGWDTSANVKDEVVAQIEVLVQHAIGHVESAEQ